MRFLRNFQSIMLVCLVIVLLSYPASVAVSSPTLDPSTPASQRGAKVIGISTSGDDGIYTCPLPQDASFINAPTVRFQPGGFVVWVTDTAVANQQYIRGMFHAVSAKASSGEYVYINIQESGFGLVSSPNTQHTLYALYIAGGQPPSVRWLDLTYKASDGGETHWRIRNLPSALHVIQGAIPQQASARINGVTLTGQAWNASQQGFPNNSPEVQAQFSAIGWNVNLSPNANTVPYTLQVAKVYPEWSAVDPARISPAYPNGVYFGGSFEQDIPLTNPSAPGRAGQWMQFQTPYVSENHYLRVVGRLKKQNVDIEKVTFHHVKLESKLMPNQGTFYYAQGANGKLTRHKMAPQYQWVATGPAQSVTTPNGLTISFLPFDQAVNDSRYMQGGGQSIEMAVKFIPNAVNKPGLFNLVTSLPRSRFYQAHHQPVQITLSPGPNYMVQTVNSLFNVYPPTTNPSGNTKIVSLYDTTVSRQMKYDPASRQMKFPPPTLPSDFTFTVYETGDIASTPVVLTIPVASSPPAMLTPHPVFRIGSPLRKPASPAH